MFHLVSGLDLWVVVVGDVISFFFCTFSFVRAFFSFSFSLSLSFFSFFFLSTLKKQTFRVINSAAHIPAHFCHYSLFDLKEHNELHTQR